MSWIRHTKGKGYRVEDRGEPGADGKRPTVAVGPYRAKKYEAVDDQKEHDAVQARVRQSTGRARASTPIAALLDRWIEAREAKGKGSDADNADVRRAVEAVAAGVEATTIPAITADAVDRWMTAHPDGARRAMRRVMRFLRWAAGAPGIPYDPQLAHLELPEAQRRRQPPALTDDQVAEILLRAYEAGGTSVGVAIEHLVLYGCRPIDAATALCSAVGDAGEITYVDPKNGDDLTHPCHPGHAKKLLRLVAGRPADAPLFLDPWGRPWRMSKDGASAAGLGGWYRNHVTTPMVKAKNLAASQLGIYCLKDYALRRLTIAARGDRRAVATVSGHRDPSVIDRYLPHNAETQRALISAVGFGPTGEVAKLAERDDEPIEPIPNLVSAKALKPYPQVPGKVRRGFAAMSPAKRAAMEAKRIAAIRASKKHRRFTAAEAAEIGRRGGVARAAKRAAARRGDAA